MRSPPPSAIILKAFFSLFVFFTLASSPSMIRAFDDKRADNLLRISRVNDAGLQRGLNAKPAPEGPTFIIILLRTTFVRIDNAECTLIEKLSIEYKCRIKIKNKP